MCIRDRSSGVLGGIPLTHTPFQHKNHIFFQIHGIRKCDRNIKYSRAALGSNFEIRVVVVAVSKSGRGNGSEGLNLKFIST